MGNQLAVQAARNQPDSVAELPNVVYKDALGGGRFFKSSLCVHDDGGLVVVKVYQKRPDSPDVRPYEEKLADIRSRLLAVTYPHVWPTQKFFHSERAVYLMRQYLFANLSRRITTRPFFSSVEKKWVAYQLLLGVIQCHERGVCHGDIKSENVLLTSWNWVFLVDFAPYKPTLLPADNPADFSSFFDTGGKRKCYIAPERFYDSASQHPSAREAASAPLTTAMDVFSAGCVLAELFLDGQPLFDYSKLLAYRQGNYDPAPALEKVESGMRQVILNMISRDPAHRKSAMECLEMLSNLGSLPAELCTVVRPFFCSMLHLDCDARVALVNEEYVHLRGRLVGGLGDKGAGSSPQLAAVAAISWDDELGSDAVEGSGSSQQQQQEQGRSRQSFQTEVASLLSQAQAVLQRLDSAGAAARRRSSSGNLAGGVGGGDRNGSSASGISLDVSSCSQPQGGAAEGGAPGNGGGQQQPAADLEGGAAASAGSLDAEGTGGKSGSSEDCMVLLAVLLCTLLRGARLQEHKTRMVSLLCDAARYCDDDTRLQRVVPYLIAATSEPLAAVKCRALRALAAVLAQVGTVPPSDAKIFTEYILPSLSLLPTEAELSVQVEYACVVSLLATTAQGFLEQQQRRRLQGGAASAGAAAGPSLLNYDEEVAHLRGAVERVVHDLLVGPHADTKLALLPHLHRLAAFCGRRDTADLLLPPLLTFLNSPQWQVRAAFYQYMSGVGPSLGSEGLVAIIHPFLDRMMTGPEDTVVAEAVCFLARVCSQGLLRKRFLLLVAARVQQLRLLQSPSTPVRAASVRYIAAAASQLSAAETYAQLLPLLRPQLAEEPLSLEAPALVVRALPAVPPPSQPPTAAAARDSGLQQTLLPSPLAAPARRATVDFTLRRSLDSAGIGTSTQPDAAQLHGSAGASGGGSATSLHAAPPVPGSHSMIIPAPASAASYSISLDSRFIHPGGSFLSAALEQSLLGSAAHGGHLIASANAAGSGGGASRGAGRLHYSAYMTPAERGAHLVARARRSTLHPAGAAAGGLGEPSSMHRQLSPGAIYGAGMYGIDESSPPGSLPAPSGVRDAMTAAMAVGLPDAAELASSAPPWQPRGVLVAHLAEHRKAVNRLAVSQNGAFFVSASSDETVKVWDCRRLEKDVSFRSRLTYTGQGGRIEAVAACHDGQSVASGSSNGSIHVWRVDYTSRAGGVPERYTGVTSMRQVTPGSGAVAEVASWGPSLLVYTTQRGGLAAWDLRMNADAWAMPYQPSQGVLEHLVLDPSAQNWLVTGSTRGQLQLWDIRFRLPVNTWYHPSGAPVARLALATAQPQRLGLRQGAAVGPLLYVAAGENEVGLWDVVEARCLQVLRVLRPGALEASRRAVPSALAPPGATQLSFASRQLDMMGRAKQLGIGELQAPQPRKDGCRVLLPTAAGPLLWAGTDRTIRYWDAARPTQSYVVCTAPPPSPIPHPAQLPAAGAQAGAGPAADSAASSTVSLVDVPRYEYGQRLVGGVPVVEEFCSLDRSTGASGSGGAGDAEQHTLRLAWAERAAAQCHGQPILDLARVDVTSQPLLLSCSHDGTIKAWK